MSVDNESPPGSWQKEWDAMSHSPVEYQREIRELRDRIKGYLKDIEMRDQVIAELRDELALLDKFWRKQNIRE
jgi:uncharacterized coiled-coil DUF342 family protein